ncbi:hypothetical protein B0J17DRAFT_709698 [Rhizoctonia solani]|nr:hypothetical protein B0J17DRAFT_709698 [Rhizoctonia solani]
MSNLPAELIHLVIDQWRPILKALSLVNKHFNHLVTPILYEKVSLKSHHSMKAFGETLRNGRSILRQYPRFLHLSYLSYATESFNCNIIQILAQVPNIIELNLSLGSSTVDFILKEPHYPFSLLRLSIVPRKNASFVEFLKMQPQIRHIILKLDRSWSNYDHRPEWSEISSPLDPSILPKLESIQSEKVDACFLIPCRPVTSVSVFDSQEDLSFHEALAKSSAPLKCLAERIQLKDYPWESYIVSRCLPSLEFCQESLVEYSLGIFPETFRFISMEGFVSKAGRSNSFWDYTQEEVIGGIRI